MAELHGQKTMEHIFTMPYEVVVKILNMFREGVITRDEARSLLLVLYVDKRDAHD